MRVHLLAIPSCQTTTAYHLDGFNMLTIRFAQLLRRLGVHVTLYGSEETEAPCVDFVQCITKAEIETMLGGVPYQRVQYEASHPLFVTFNARVGAHLRGIKQPGDVLCTICGTAQQPVWNQHPDVTCVEYSIGYRGIFAPYRIFQSHVWRHVVMGYTGCDGGREFDGVIPMFYNVDEFPFQATPNDYVLFCGRLDVGKGIKTACLAAEKARARLLIIGHGDPSNITYGEYLGAVDNEARNRWMAGARAVLMPTQYVEPFGSVCAEAQLCGTPVISSDYGAFTETIEHGQTGYRCTYLGQYLEALEMAADLDRTYIRARAQRLWSMETAERSYRAYFNRLALVKGDGWYSTEPSLLQTEDTVTV